MKKILNVILNVFETQDGYAIYEVGDKNGPQ